MGHAESRIPSPWRRPSEGVLRGDAAFGPKNIIWAWRMATTPRCRSTSSLRRKHTERPLPDVQISSQKMGIHEWSYDNDISNDKRYRVPHRDKSFALKDIRAEVELGYDVKLALGEAQRCLNCDIQTVFHLAALHRMRRVRRHLPMDASPSPRTAKRPICARASRRRRRTSTKPSTSPTA